MPEEIRTRILAAAARVYAQYGFRGATTRLIATEADVNEVTLFRTFGSKAQLLHAMLAAEVDSSSVPLLPTGEVEDPEAELIRWCTAMLAYLRGHAPMVRKTIAEAEERPEAACAACEGPNVASRSLVLFLEHFRETGRVDADADVETAVSMFMSAMFGDALYRDVLPNAFPQPVDAAAGKYVQTFLRAVGLRAAPARALGARVAGSRGRNS